MKNNTQYAIETKIVMPLRGVTLFPGILCHFDVGRDASIKGAELAMERGEDLFIVTQSEMYEDEPTTDDLYSIGVVAKVRQILKLQNNSYRVLVETISRARLAGELVSGEHFSAPVETLPEEVDPEHTNRDVALLRSLREVFQEYNEFVPRMPKDVPLTVMTSERIAHLTDFVGHYAPLENVDQQSLLEQLDPRKRLLELIKILVNETKILKIEAEIAVKTHAQMERNQRDYFLREQIKIIGDELGEEEDTAAESQRYISKITQLQLDEKSEEKLVKEATRLARLQSYSPESGVIRAYLDACIELPWNKTSKENTNIKRAETILNTQHYGLEKVKERILELFAVKMMSGNIKGQILCLVGPPGVGKTSVARSIAQSLGRNYARLSLGGVRDEADIRGHRKTYIGAMPGRIISALNQAGTKNSLILIDEIDKLASDMRGDPSAALLEVFDTEQNVEFRDHYIELPFDLSDVLFIATANTLDTIPRPLLDRMEIIELPGYTDEEKLQIAKKHLLPKQLKKHGLTAAKLKISDAAIKKVIRGYTREAGVRTLEREIAHLCRKVDKKMISESIGSVSIKPENITEYLGIIKYKGEIYSDKSECGVVNGLAWTSVGGEILEVEANTFVGTGKLTLTGNLGDVMKESAQAAISYIRANTDALNIPNDFHSKTDIHIHFPEGAVPKDGPSAGVTTATAIVSALTKIPMPRDIAMTGEVTIRGRVLPIGGLREKTMAAYRAGIKTVIVPFENEADLQEIDSVVAKAITFHTAKTMDDVLLHALGIKAPKVITNIAHIEIPNHRAAVNYVQ